MIIPIIYPSACEFWLDGTLRRKLDVFSLNKRIPISLPVDFSFIPEKIIIREIAERVHLNLPLHVYVSNAHDRRFRPDIVCKVLPSAMPPDSFVKVGTIRLTINGTAETADIYAASPEMCFLQAAQALSVQELALLGCNLSAGFVRDNTAEFFQRRREILTDNASINRFLSKADHYPGINKAVRASKYIQNNSNSPVESKLAVMASLPFHLGGQALAGQELNGRIHLSDEASDYIGRRTLFGDMVWPTAKVVVEYDSSLCHSKQNQVTFDKKRVAAVTQSGYRVITLTENDIKNISALDRAFALIRSALGIRSAEKVLKKYYDRRQALFDSLFA